VGILEGRICFLDALEYFCIGIMLNIHQKIKIQKTEKRKFTMVMGYEG
jgi:hypothetical protein